jgi:hypothetical protein
MGLASSSFFLHFIIINSFIYNINHPSDLDISNLFRLLLNKIKMGDLNAPLARRMTFFAKLTSGLVFFSVLLMASILGSKFGI